MTNYNQDFPPDESNWIDEAKVLQITEVSTETASSLLIKSNYLKNFLEASSLAIVFIGYQDKLLITNDVSIPPTFHKVRNVFVFDGDNIINIYHMSRISRHLQK